MFRAGEALYHLRRYDDCCQILEKLCRLFPLNTLAQAASGRAQSRLREQKTGEYNFKLLQAEAKKIRPPHLDHATYIGPVEVKQTASKGRGLFVTKAVKAGDLLLCEKAFAHCYASNKSDGENAGGSNISILINAEADTIVMGTQAELLKTMIQKIYHNPSLAPALTTLYHGDYQGLDTLLVDEMPIVDTSVLLQFIPALLICSSLVFWWSELCHSTLLVAHYPVSTTTRMSARLRTHQVAPFIHVAPGSKRRTSIIAALATYAAHLLAT